MQARLVENLRLYPDASVRRVRVGQTLFNAPTKRVVMAQLAQFYGVTLVDLEITDTTVCVYTDSNVRTFKLER